MNKVEKGILIAGAAAALLMSGSIVARAGDKTGGDMVHCAGINECKGHGACAGNGHACAGKNACKGQGITKTTADDCAKKGGKVVPEEE
jgi:hypothetical protein